MFFKKRLKIKPIHPEAVIPEYKTGKSSGFDLHAILEAADEIRLRPGETRIIKTGLMVQIPRGYELQIRPRSGVSVKTGLRIANAPGTIDEDYRGEIGIIVQNVGNDCAYINHHDRIAQGVICPVYRPKIKVVKKLNETKRGAGGFGHTGN